MIWFILGAIILIPALIKGLIVDQLYNHPKEFVQIVIFSIILFGLVAIIANGLCAILFCRDKTNTISETVSYNEILPISDDDYVKWNSDGSMVCLLDTGYYNTYKFDITTQVKVCQDNETPSIKVIRYKGWTDVRKYLSIWCLISDETIITLPPGITKPIT